MTEAVYNIGNPDLVHAANEFVNQVFLGTMLREFRNAQQPTIVDGGSGRGTFARQLDLELIKRISQGGQSPVVSAVLRQLVKQPSAVRQLRAALGRHNHPTKADIPGGQEGIISNG